ATAVRLVHTRAGLSDRWWAPRPPPDTSEGRAATVSGPLAVTRDRPHADPIPPMSPTSQLLAYVQTGLLAALVIVLTLVLLGMPDRSFLPRPAAPSAEGADVLLEPLQRLNAILASLPQRLAPDAPAAAESR